MRSTWSILLLCSLVSVNLVSAAAGWGDRYRYDFIACTDELCEGLGSCATILQHPRSVFGAKESCLAPLANGECIDFSDWWQDLGDSVGRVSGVDTKNTCAIVWSEKGCKGVSKKLNTGKTGYQHMEDLDFDNLARSVSSCVARDEPSGIKFRYCKREKFNEVPLFYGSTFTRGDIFGNALANEAFEKMRRSVGDAVKNGLKFVPGIGEVVSGLETITSQFDKFFKSDIEGLAQAFKEKNLEDKRDFKIAQSVLGQMRSAIQHCSDLLHGNSTESRSDNDVDYCFNRLSESMLMFKENTLMDASLASAPLLIEMIPFFQGIQLLERETNITKTKNVLCIQTERLVEILVDFKSKALEQRKQLFRIDPVGQCSPGLVDEITGKGYHSYETTISYETGHILCLPINEDYLTVCKRDLLIDLTKRMDAAFEPSVKSVRDFLELLQCN